MAQSSIHLQALGQTEAKPAKDFAIGDFAVWNYGHTSEVLSVSSKDMDSDGKSRQARGVLGSPLALITDKPPRLTLAQRQAAWRKRREERQQLTDEALLRIRDEAKTLREARDIATKALATKGATT